MPSIFERREVKYVMTKEQYEKLMSAIRDQLVEEEFFKYKILNIYYDTKNFDLFRKSSEKPEFKEKLRVRNYGEVEDGKKVFLEVKKKYKGIVYKRRIELEREEVYEAIRKRELPMQLKTINQREIGMFLKRYELEPQVYLSYDREAYQWKTNPDFRMTFDQNIRYRLNDVLFEEGDEGEHILDKDKVLMELKCLNSLPLEFSRLLSALGIFNVSFSKIGSVYKKVILPELRKNK